MICLFVVCCLFLGVAVAQPNETLYVDSEWIVPANVTSDGSIERPFLNLSGVADTITDWAMQGLDMLAVTVHLAPRLYSGPANCFQMLNLLVMAEFELHGAWTNGSTLGGNLLDSATFECVNTAPRNTRQLTWLGLFGARDRFVMSDVTFRRSRATCASAWLTYDVTLDDPAPSPHPPVPLLRCMPYIGLPRVICGGVVLSTAQHRNGTDVTFRRVHFHDNVVNVTAPLQGNLVVAERKAHSPLMVLARGFSTSCDSVTVTESTFLNNTLEIVVYPTSSTAVFSGNFRTYGAVGGGALTVSGGDLVAVNCTFFGNTARIALASLLLITARQPSRLYFNVVAGGALMIDYGRGAVIANSTFANNTAASFRSGGGAIALRWSDEVPVEVRRNQLAPSVLVVNSVLANNSANDGSMGAVDWESLPFNSSHDADHAVVWESLGGALAAGLVWPNSTRKFVVVGVSLRNCTVTANSVFAVVVGRQPSCFGGAVMAASVIVENSLLADNSAACEDASGGAIETEIARAQDSAFVGNTVSSLVPFGSAGGSFSNRKLLAIDAEVCGDTVWSVLGCSFAANASDTPGDEELERVVGAAVMIDAQCMPRQFMLQNTSFVGFRAATIFEVTADRLLLDTASVVDCSGSFVFHMHDLVDNFGIMASINVTNSTAQFGPLIDLSAATVKLNVVATNVTMQNDAIVKVTARYAKVYPQFDNCDCLSSFACDATAIDVAILGGATSTVEMLDGVFRRVRGKSVVRMIQIAEHNYTGLSVTNVQVLECEVGSAVVFETHMEQSAATILHHTITLDDSVVANNAIANSVVRHVGAGRVTPGSLGMINGTVAGNRAFTTKDVAVFEMLVLDRFAGAIDITGSTAPGVLVKECVFRDNVGVAVARGALLTTMRSLFVNNTVSGSLLGTFRGWALINVTETTFRHNVGALLHASAAGLPADKVPPRILFDSVNVFDHASDFPLIELSLPAMNASLLLFDVTFDSVVLDDSLAMAYNVSELVVVRSVFRNVSAAPLASTCGGSLFIGYCDSVLIENTAFLNSSAAFGGAVCVGRTASLIQSNLTFANNRARVGADVFYVSADVARAVDANLTVAPTRASVASSVSLSGFERGVMSGVPVDLTFAMRDVFGRAPAAHQERPVSMARFAVDLATVNCTHDHSDVSFLCVISESDHECVARVAFVGAPDTECALNYTVRPIDAAQPRALAAVGGAPTLTGASLMSIVPCAIGFGATLSENGTTACEPCSPGTYNVDASVQRCFACVNERLFCAGRNLVTAQDGYWARRLGDGSILTLMCDADVCLAGTPGRDLSRCVAGRTGVLCALCTEPSFTPVAPKDGVLCIECRGVSWPLVVGGVAAVTALALVLHVSVVGTSARVKVLFFYTQTIALVLPKSIARTVFAAFDFHPVSGTAAFGGVCIAPLNGFQLLALHLSYPLLLASTLTLVFLVRHAVVALWRLRRPTAAAADAAAAAAASAPSSAASLPSTLALPLADDEAASDDTGGGDVPLVVSSRASLSPTTDSALPSVPLFSWVRWQRSIMSFAFLSFSVVLDCAIKLTQCDEIDRSLSVLAADARELCVKDGVLNPVFAEWRALALYGLAPYVALIVVALPVITWWRHARPHAHLWRNKMRWGFLSDGYRPRFHYWECVILARRIVFGLVCALLPLDSELRQQAVLAACLVALSAHVMAQPFVHDSDNAAESLSLLALTFNGAAFQRALFGQSGVGFYLSVVCIVAPAVIIGGSIAVAKLRSVVSLVRRRRARAAR